MYVLPGSAGALTGAPSGRVEELCNGSWRQGAAHIQLALRPSAAWTLLLLLQNYRIGNHCIRHLIKLNELTALNLSQARCWEGVLRCGCPAQLYCTVCRGVMYPAARPHSLLTRVAGGAVGRARARLLLPCYPLTRNLNPAPSGDLPAAPHAEPGEQQLRGGTGLPAQPADPGALRNQGQALCRCSQMHMNGRRAWVCTCPLGCHLHPRCHTCLQLTGVVPCFLPAAPAPLLCCAVDKLLAANPDLCVQGVAPTTQRAP